MVSKESMDSFDNSRSEDNVTQLVNSKASCGWQPDSLQQNRCSLSSCTQNGDIGHEDGGYPPPGLSRRDTDLPTYSSHDPSHSTGLNRSHAVSPCAEDQPSAPPLYRKESNIDIETEAAICCAGNGFAPDYVPYKRQDPVWDKLKIARRQ